MSAEGVEALLRLSEVAQAWLAAGFLVFLRVGAAMALMPAFGEQVVPMRIRLAATFAFTVLLTPALADRLAPFTSDADAIAAAALPEVVAGLALGIAVRLFVMTLQIAGTMAAQSISLAQFFGGHGVDPQPALSQFLVMGGLALATATGLHVWLTSAFLESYDVLPPGRFVPAGALAEWGVARVAQTFSMAFVLASPFLIAALLYNIALGAINRAMPQLMVVFIGAPALVGGGLLLMLLVVPVILGLWLEGLNGFLRAPFEVAP